MRLPYAWADRAHAHTVFHESTLASGTVKAREIKGFIRGSRRRAAAAGHSAAGGASPDDEHVGVERGHPVDSPTGRVQRARGAAAWPPHPAPPTSLVVLLLLALGEVALMVPLVLLLLALGEVAFLVLLVL